MEAYEGVTKKVEVKSPKKCNKCSGKGYIVSPDSSTCKVCSGSGRIRMVNKTILGDITSYTTCRNCKGTGYGNINTCGFCDGGYILKNRIIEVDIPKGITNGGVITLMGKGMLGKNGGSPGDIKFVVKVDIPEYYTLQGSDVLYKTDINFFKLILGGNISIPMVNGSTSKLKIAPNTKSGKGYIMRGKGMPSEGGNRYGDMKIIINAYVPKNVDQEDIKNIIKNREFYKVFDPMNEDESV